VRFSDAFTTNNAVDSIQRLGYSVYGVADLKPTAAFPNGVRFGIIDLPPEADIDNAITKLAVMPGILYVERDAVYYLSNPPVIPDDPLFPLMWGLHNHDLPSYYWDPDLVGEPVDDADIDMPEAWSICTGSDEIIVAVVDTGIYIDHLDLAPNIWVNEAELYGEPGIDDDGNGYVDDIHGWDFHHNDNSVFDPDDRKSNGELNDIHGTHVAGTIGALSDNAQGVSGINWNVRIMPLKAFGPGGGTTSNAMLALEYAANNGAAIANCSWGGGSYSQALKDTIEASGMLVVCAAGNDGENTDIHPHYPSSYDSSNIISVAASAQNDEPCYYPGWWSTNYGENTVDLFAPGGYIASTVPPDPPPLEPGEAYGFAYGTSMATPHVSGVAALVSSCYPSMPLYPDAPGWHEGSPTVKDLLLDKADVKPAFQGKCMTGGRLNAAAALGLGSEPIIISATATPTAGAPPLEVAFSAVAMTPVGEITDVWWDFGDGTDIVSAYDAVHTYNDLGEYEAAFHVVNDSGLESVAIIPIRVFVPPVIEVDPVTLDAQLKWGETIGRSVIIRNTGEGILEYSISLDFVGLEGASVPEWITVTPMQGTVNPGESKNLNVTFNAHQLARGTWHANIEVSSNDPLCPRVVIDTALHVKSIILPTIESISADPWAGKPPLEVHFFAVAYDEDGEITCIEWDFGDGTDFLTGDLSPNHVYTEEGEFEATLTVTDDDGLTSEATTLVVVRPQPQAAIEPAEFRQVIRAHRTRTDKLMVTNTGDTDLVFAATVQSSNTSAFEITGESDTVSWATISPNAGTVEPGQSLDLDVTFDLGSVSDGQLTGEVIFEVNDIREPRKTVPITIEVTPNRAPVISACAVNPAMGAVETLFQFVASAHDADGEISDVFWVFGDGSPNVHQFVTTHSYAEEGIYTASFHAIDNDGYETASEVTTRVELPPVAGWTPNQFSFRMPPGSSNSSNLTLTNAGTGNLVFGMSTIAELQSAGENPDCDSSAGLPSNVGRVIKSWHAPAPMEVIWGVAVHPQTGNLVISDRNTRRDYVVTSDGEFTGVSWPTPWAGSTPVEWAGGMAFDREGQYLWQRRVGGDNGIYKLEARTGDFVGSITGGPWSIGDDHRGLAHNPNNDTFYVREWEEGVVCQIKGDSWNSPGEVIDQWDLDVRIADLAYHPIADVLAVVTCDRPDMVYLIDAESGSIIAEFLHPSAGDYEWGYVGAGCDFDVDGNLWLTFCAYGENILYLVETGLGAIGGWLGWNPRSGEIPPGGSMDITVTADAAKLNPGKYASNVVLVTNDPDNQSISIPVIADITKLPTITEVTVSPSMGEPPLEVSFHAAFECSDVPVASYWWDFGDGNSLEAVDAVNTYDLPGMYTATFTVTDMLGGKADTSFLIDVRWLPHATVDPERVDVTLPSNATVTKTVTIGNVEGNSPLMFSAAAKRGERPLIAMPERIGVSTSPDAVTAEGLYAPLESEIVERLTSAVKSSGMGDVILSWRVPLPIARPWGIGFDEFNETLWISDPGSMADHVVMPDGTHMGMIFDTPWATAFPADMAYDRNRSLMWQVNVQGDNGIYALDPETGDVVMKIASGPWTAKSQRGLAYRDDDDTFYIGGWVQDIIYRIKGPSWDMPGEVLEQWAFPVGIAGLAWHPSGVLWVSSNADPDMIYGIDAASRTVVAQFPHPYGGFYSGAGLALNPDGNLWVVSPKNHTVYLVNNDMPISRGISIHPVEGIVPEGLTLDVTVTIDAAEINNPGNDVRSYLEFLTNDPLQPALYVDVDTHIEEEPSFAEVNVSEPIGEPPLSVVFDAVVAPGAGPIADVWWDFGDGSPVVHGLHVEHVYTEVGTYEASIHAMDDSDVEVSQSIMITVKWLPLLEVHPEKIQEVVSYGTPGQQDTLYVTNSGKGSMEFGISVVGDGLSSAISLSHTSGLLLPGNGDSVLITFGSSELPPGIYEGTLVVTSDDPRRPKIEIPVMLKVDLPPAIMLMDPKDGDRWTGEQKIRWTASDPDDDVDTLAIVLYWSRDGGEWHEIAKGLANTGSYMWNTASVGLGGDAFRVRIVATDPAGQSAEIISEPFTIINDAPTAAFSFSPSPVTVTSIVEFVDESTDDGEIVAWHWEFGDGVESSEQNPKHQYSAKGTFTVKLTVNDDGGLTGVCEKQIQVVNVVPTVKVLRPEAGETWARAREIEYEATDPDGDPLAIKLEYDYLGDESGWQLIAEGQENMGKHLWDISKLAKGGLYKVRVTAADPDGGIAEAVSGEFTIIVLKHLVMAAPNPARNSVTFYYDIESDATIYVYDVAGRLVYSAELAAGTNAHEWNLTTGDKPLAAGLYFYAVVTVDGARSEVGRLVIER
jgi:PKD repeat protein